MKRYPLTIATARSASMYSEAHPTINATDRYIIPVMNAIVNRSIPFRSNFSLCVNSFGSLSFFCAHQVATIPIGTLKKKFSLQSIMVKNPPSIGPNTKAAAAIMDMIPIARPSSRCLKASATIMIPFDIRSEPPTACKTRYAISWVMSAENPHNRDPIVKNCQTPDIQSFPAVNICQPSPCGRKDGHNHHITYQNPHYTEQICFQIHHNRRKSNNKGACIQNP